MVHKYSPNWYWEQLGFKVSKRENGKRVVLNLDICTYCESAPHSVEQYLGEYEYRTSIGDIPDSERIDTDKVIKDYQDSTKCRLSPIAEGIMKMLISTK